MLLRAMPAEKPRVLIGMMRDDTARLALLIDRILGAARIERRHGRYTLEPASMRHFTEAVLEQDRHLFEKDGHKAVFERGGDARVEMDREAMSMVLANLNENATRYSP